MCRAKLFEEYLDKKNRIIRPALIELVEELISNSYAIKTLDGGRDRDLLVEELNELHKSEEIRTPLLGQMAIKIKKNGFYSSVFIGFLSGQVQIVNPGTDYVSKIDLENMQVSSLKSEIKKLLKIETKK